MRDPEFDLEANRSPKAPRSRHGRRVFRFALLAFLGYGFFGTPICSRCPYECAVCRLKRVERSCSGLTWTQLKENECSRWYRNNIEPSHSHFWMEGTHCRRFGIPIIYGGYSCRIGNPLTGLPLGLQIKIYKTFKDRLEAKQLFIRLAQLDKQSFNIWKPMMEWIDAGLPGTWDDWWQKRRPTVEPREVATRDALR